MHLNFEVNKHVLLTGAGCTRNFGGFLANEMWAWIFNDSNIEKNHQLKGLVKTDFDYESIYYKVIDGIGFNDDEKKALKGAVYSAYKKLDDKIRSLGTNQLVCINEFSKFIERFSGYPASTGRNDTKGFFFTLNQDLFIERYCSPPNFKPITLYAPQPKLSQDEVYDENIHSVNLPSIADIEQINPLSSTKFFYVKLHGSWNWYSSDGKKRMVIGRNKINQINTEPVLLRYFEIFKEVLSKGDVRLFVIGYGFRDEHINDTIADAIMNNNLKLYVLNPSNPEMFKNDFHSDKIFRGEIIWNGLAGYYPYNLSQVFPGAETVEYELIRDSYFDS